MGVTFALIRLRFGRNLGLILGVAVLASAVSWVWWEIDFLSIHDSERSAYDDGLKKFTGNPKIPWKWAPGGAVTKSNDIIIVAIDDQTFTGIEKHWPWQMKYGSYPYDRMLWADVFTYLTRVGARAIVFDTVMEGSSAGGVGDVALGKAIAEEGIPLYLGFSVTPSPKSDQLPKVEKPSNRSPPKPQPTVAQDQKIQPPELDQDFPEEPPPEQAVMLLKARAAQAYAFPVEVSGGLEIPKFEKSSDIHDSHPMVAIEQVLDVVAGFGHVGHEHDEDGKMRRTSFVYTDGINNYATLPVAVAADVFGASKLELAPGLLKLGDHQIPTNPEGDVEIDYGGTLSNRFEAIPLVDVLRYMTGTAGGEEKFKGKFVFVAGFAVGTGDSKSTPLEANTPGVVKQAATLQNLLDGRFILRSPLWVSLLFTFLVALFSATLVLVIRNTYVDIGWPVLLYAGFFFLTGGFLVATKIHILSALPSLAGTLSSILAIGWERLFAQKDREMMKAQFSNFMEADLVDQMIESKTLPKLDGDNIHITAFFSDIKGFSTFSEKFRDEPKQLMRLLNRYLSTVTPILTGEGACIDKYIGDAVVALFGAPVFYKDHAVRACRAALEVQKAIGKLREDFRFEGLPDVYTRIGLNTDEMLVGNIGSQQLYDYTALGDGMNLAARLEGANKAFGTLVMIGKGTFLAAGDRIETRELDEIRVAGKHHSTTVYELLGMRGEVAFDKAKVVELYAQALSSYRARQFELASGSLKSALQIDEGDGPSQRLLRICQDFIATPPPPDWDGVSELEK